MVGFLSTAVKREARTPDSDAPISVNESRPARLPCVRLDFLKIDALQKMSIVERLTCECWPGKVFANKASLRKHQQSQKHIEHTKRNEEKQLRIRNAELECELAKLRHDFEMVKAYLQNPNRRHVTPRMKKEVGARAKWRCEGCQNTVNANYEIDHIIPLYQAGDNTLQNLQLLCPDCHRTKTAQDRDLGSLRPPHCVSSPKCW